MRHRSISNIVLSTTSVKKILLLRISPSFFTLSTWSDPWMYRPKLRGRNLAKTLGRAVRHWLTSLNITIQKLKPYSNLITVTKSDYDFGFYDPSDPFDNEPKLEHEIKTEIVNEGDINVTNDQEFNNLPVEVSNPDAVPAIETVTVEIKPYDITNVYIQGTSDERKEFENVEYPDPNVGQVTKIRVKDISSLRGREKKSNVKDTEFKKRIKNTSKAGSRKKKPDGKEAECKENTSEEETVEQKYVKVEVTEEEVAKMRENKRNHHNYKKLPFKCDSCVLGFTKQNTYEKHVEDKHSESIGPHKCPVCECRFSSSLSAARHTNRHYTRYKCVLCAYSTSEVCAALAHCRAKHARDSVRQIHCAHCDVVVKTAKELDAHTKTEHTLQCNDCGDTFKGKDTLRRHIRCIHLQKRRHKCTICSKTFINKTRLEVHMSSHGGNIARSLAYCRVCRVQYKNIYVYRSHLKNSSNHAERMSCPDCNKKFASKVYWLKHYNFYHLHKSQFKCDLCNKIFISNWRLNNHRQMHHGLSRTRDHPCNICGKKFYTSTTLRNHKYTHSDQRSFMCEDCGDTFKQRAALYTHCKLVHKT
ncbi:uncharacterized protein LOC142985507 isoform X2 [Anticarsia gemmatalis]|uniref:uncharacterized protein LOC142985507 isoform X2 n=1 Tax=Anticarsia gemmatalis TaxID=129554 RepID=UPI003F7681B8